MAVPIQLYNAGLFGQATEHIIVRSLNNAPGGYDGVDHDVQYRLGANNSPNGMLDRRHGICCGITIAWLVGLIGGRSEAVSSSEKEFKDYFNNVLRFQGAYLKDYKGNIGALDALDIIQPQGCKLITKNKHLLPHQIVNDLPSKPVWAAYLGIYHHAIGIGYQNYRYFIMDPNAGLFNYRNKGKFLTDLNKLIEARRTKKKIIGPGNTISAWFYGK